MPPESGPAATLDGESSTQAGMCKHAANGYACCQHCKLTKLECQLPYCRCPEAGKTGWGLRDSERTPAQAQHEAVESQRFSMSIEPGKSQCRHKQPIIAVHACLHHCMQAGYMCKAVLLLFSCCLVMVANRASLAFQVSPAGLLHLKN